MALAATRNPELADRVFEATASLLIEKGARNLRTAEIARRVGIPESTLFRNFRSVNELLPEVNRWAWGKVNERVAREAFSQPTNTARDALLGDIHAICEMRSDRADRIAATFAFLFHRRARELDVTSSSEIAEFEHRMRVLCGRLTFATGDAPDTELADLVSLLLLNYLATIWMTWNAAYEAGQAGRADILSVEMAEAGAEALIDRIFASSSA